MALNKKALKTLKAAWLAIVAFSTYPIIENIILTKFLVVNMDMMGFIVLASSYYPVSEFIGLVVSVVRLLPRLKIIKKQIKRGEVNRSTIKCIIQQGVLTAAGNILLIVAQRLSTNPVTVVTLGIIPIAYWVIKDIFDGKEKGIKISSQFMASVLPIVVTIFQSWPFSLNGEFVTISLLIVRAILVIHIERLEKDVSHLDESLVYAIRQGITFISALTVAVVILPIIFVTGSQLQSMHLITECIMDVKILGGIIIVMLLSNIAGEWKIFAKNSNSVSLVLIMLNAPVLISIVSSFIIYWVLFSIVVPISVLFAATSTVCLATLVLSLLVERTTKT